MLHMRPSELRCRNRRTGRTMNLNDLRTFVLVTEHGSFAGAAQRLGVPRSTVTRRVRRLEEALGVALLRRSSRSFALSEDGKWVVEQATGPLRDLHQVGRGLQDRGTEPVGELRLTTPIDLGTTGFLAELIAAYATAAPDVRVSLTIANRHLDLLEEDVDLAIRLHASALPSRDDIVARRLGTITLGLYASPTYLAAHGTPGTLTELSSHRVLVQSDLAPRSWNITPAVTANDYGPLAAFAAAGAGIAMLPELVAEGLERRGELQKLDLPSPEPFDATMSLVWLRTRHLAPRVRRFVGLAVEHFAQRAPAPLPAPD